MSVFVVIIKDRHADIEVEAWADREEAIDRARYLAKEYCSFPRDYHEEAFEGSVFYARYSCEGDSTRVVETVLNKPSEVGP